MTDVCFSKPEILITQAWIELYDVTTKFGLLIDTDLLKRGMSANSKPEV